MIALVTGGRDYRNRQAVFNALDNAGPALVIEGGAVGADRLAREWAIERGVPYATVPAQWESYGRRAGPVRNGWMLLLKPDVLIAFPGGRGTANMVDQAKRAGLHTIHVTVENTPPRINQVRFPRPGLTLGITRTTNAS